MTSRALYLGIFEQFVKLYFLGFKAVIPWVAFFMFWVFNPIGAQPRRVHESGSGRHAV